MLTSWDDCGSLLRQGRALLTLGLLTGMLASCGYTLVGASPGASGGLRPLAIAPFTNHTPTPDLERLMTAALRQAMLHNQLLTTAAQETTAPRLHGAIRRFRSFPVSFDANDNVLQYRIEVDVSLRLLDTTTQRPMLEQDVSTSAEYLVSRANTDRVREDVVAREAALARLAQQFADKCLALVAMALL